MTADQWTALIRYEIGRQTWRAVSGEIPAREAKRLVLELVEQALDDGIEHAVLYAAVRDGQCAAQRALEELVADREGLPRINSLGNNDVPS